MIIISLTAAESGIYLLGHKSTVGGQISSSQVTASSSAQGQLGLKKIVILTIAMPCLCLLNF